MTPTNIEKMLTRARVSFNTKEYVAQEGYLSVDMHIHTRYSDTLTKVTSILKKAQKLGIGISITDHNEIAGAVRASQKDSGVFMIPGIEVSTAEGPHVLAYFEKIQDLIHFYENYVKPAKTKDPYTSTNLSIHDMIRVCKTYNSLTSIAHPFSPGVQGIQKHLRKSIIDLAILKEVDALEVINGAVTRTMNSKALELTEKLSKGVTAGSDSHSLFEVGKVISYAEASSVKEFFYRIRKNQNLAVGRGLGIRRLPSMAKQSQHMIYHPITAVKNNYSNIIKPNAKIGKKKAMIKVRDLKERSFGFIRAPVRSTKKVTKKVTKKAGKILKSGRKK